MRLSSAAAASSAAASQSIIATRAPSRTMCAATACPMPLAAPVTSTVLPSNVTPAPWRGAAPVLPRCPRSPPWRVNRVGRRHLAHHRPLHVAPQRVLTLRIHGKPRRNNHGLLGFGKQTQAIGHRRFGGFLRSHGGERAGPAGDGAQAGLAELRFERREMADPAPSRRQGRRPPGSRQTSGSRRRPRECPRVPPATTRARHDRPRGRWRDRDRGDSCPASRSPVRHHPRGTRPNLVVMPAAQIARRHSTMLVQSGDLLDGPMTRADANAGRRESSSNRYRRR